MIKSEKHDGLLYSVAWPFINRTDLINYLKKQKGSAHDKQLYPLAGATFMYVETPERTLRGEFKVRSLKAKCFDGLE